MTAFFFLTTCALAVAAVHYRLDRDMWRQECDAWRAMAKTMKPEPVE
jgi:hypothetical protein